MFKMGTGLILLIAKCCDDDNKTTIESKTRAIARAKGKGNSNGNSIHIISDQFKTSSNCNVHSFFSPSLSLSFISFVGMWIIFSIHVHVSYSVWCAAKSNQRKFESIPKINKSAKQDRNSSIGYKKKSNQTNERTNKKPQTTIELIGSVWTKKG